MNLLSNLIFLIEYLDIPEAVGEPGASWEIFQLRHLNDPSILGIEIKARQVGWSWLAAAESVASAVLNDRTPHIFISLNQEEAGEKIRYAKQIIEALDAEVRPRLLIDNAYELEFTNGSRLISHPCRPPRGKAKAHIYLDEFAHYPNDRQIYQAAVPVLSKGGRIRIGSTPLGARGMFWEIFSESVRKYPGYSRQLIPWWRVKSLCKDVKAAEQVAPQMPVDERVQAFGSDRLVVIHENMTIEDFKQEYECDWQDEAISFVDWELIKRNQMLASAQQHWYRKAEGVEGALAAINDVAEEVRADRIEPVLFGGMDVGRTRDATEIILLGGSKYTNQNPYRLHITLKQVEFDGQEAVVEKLLRQLPVRGFLIDRNGIGMQLAENVGRKFPQAEGVGFTNASKAAWANELKLRLQRAEIPIPLERDLMYQMHSVRKKVTGANNTVYDVEGNDKHHADMFWALALAVWAAKDAGPNQERANGNPLSGYRG